MDQDEIQKALIDLEFAADQLYAISKRNKTGRPIKPKMRLKSALVSTKLAQQKLNVLCAQQDEGEENQ